MSNAALAVLELSGAATCVGYHDGRAVRAMLPQPQLNP